MSFRLPLYNRKVFKVNVKSFGLYDTPSKIINWKKTYKIKDFLCVRVVKSFKSVWQLSY